MSLPRKAFCPNLRRFAAFTSGNYYILRFQGRIATLNSTGNRVNLVLTQYWRSG
jgi:hypothetical protein